MEGFFNKLKLRAPQRAGLVIYPAETRSIPFTVPVMDAKSRYAVESLGSSVESSGGPADAGDRSRADYSRAEEFGNLEPSLYMPNDSSDESHIDFPPNHIGRLWFSLRYEQDAEKLYVGLKKAKNLPSRVVSNPNSCDPFVKINLLPDERRTIQSKFKKKNCNPRFDEEFTFPVSSKSVHDRVLKLTVVDVDRSKRHNVIGHVIYPIRQLTLDSGETVKLWRDLETDVQEVQDKGELDVSLNYNDTLHRMTVSVYNGRNFMATVPSGQSPSFYVKVSLLKQGKNHQSQRTGTVKKSENPVFNESFLFKFSSADLDYMSIRISAMQSFIGRADKIVGQISLGSFMFARGKELDHWNQMRNSPKESVTQSHQLQ